MKSVKINGNINKKYDGKMTQAHDDAYKNNVHKGQQAADLLFVNFRRNIIRRYNKSKWKIYHWPLK